MLAQQKVFSLAKSTGGIMHLAHQPEPPEITTRQMILPQSYQKQAILALHNATHAGAMATTKMARSCYFWKGMNKDIKGIINSCNAVLVIINWFFELSTRNWRYVILQEAAESPAGLRLPCPFKPSVRQVSSL